MVQNIFKVNNKYAKTTSENAIKFAEAYSEPCQTSKIELFAKIVDGFLAINYFFKTHHLRCLTGFGKCLWISTMFLYSIF